jgi:uncharacterized protein (TIGR03067 family)
MAKNLTNAQALEKMQGTWEVVSLEHDGVPINLRDREGDVRTVVVRKDSYVIRGVSRREPYVITNLSTRTAPWRIDMKFANPGSPPSRPIPGSFKFEGDKLLIMKGEAGGQPPDNFDAKCPTKIVLRKAKGKQ